MKYRIELDIDCDLEGVISNKKVKTILESEAILL